MWGSPQLLGACSGWVQASCKWLRRFWHPSLPTCKYHFRPDTFTLTLPISLSASSQPHFPLFLWLLLYERVTDVLCGSCSTLSFPCSSEPFLLVFATFSILNTLSSNYAIMTIKHVRAHVVPRQTKSSLASQHRCLLCSPQTMYIMQSVQ